MDQYFSINHATTLMALLVIALLWWDIKQSHKEDVEEKKHQQEEQEALGNGSEVTLTRVKLERYLRKVLELLASEKLTKIIITDEKEALHGVILSYGEYKALLAFKELCEHNAKERILWQESAKMASHDEEYTKELHELE